MAKQILFEQTLLSSLGKIFVWNVWTHLGASMQPGLCLAYCWTLITWKYSSLTKRLFNNCSKRNKNTVYRYHETCIFYS